MKEYEKLARSESNLDYFKDKRDYSELPACLAFIDGYKKGFLKAREMVEGMYPWRDTGILEIHIDSLRDLGEGEV